LKSSAAFDPSIYTGEGYLQILVMNCELMLLKLTVWFIFYLIYLTTLLHLQTLNKKWRNICGCRIQSKTKGRAAELTSKAVNTDIWHEGLCKI